MSRFDACFPVVLGNEGDLVDHVADNGGRTNAGVTQATFDAYMDSIGSPRRPVDTIETAEIEDIYRGFWERAKCDDLPMPLDCQVFDVSINSGHIKAIVLLQRALRMRSEHHTGNFGPITRATLQEQINKHGIRHVCRMYLRERRKFYAARVKLQPNQIAFFDGWLNRVDHMEDLMEGALA